jgi:hypothetical protein
MMETNKMVSGNTSTTIRGETKIKNLRITSNSKSFPASSAMYTQTDCNKKISINMVKTLKNDFK